MPKTEDAPPGTATIQGEVNQVVKSLFAEVRVHPRTGRLKFIPREWAKPYLK